MRSGIVPTVTRQRSMCHTAVVDACAPTTCGTAADAASPSLVDAVTVLLPFARAAARSARPFGSKPPVVSATASASTTPDSVTTRQAIGAPPLASVPSTAVSHDAITACAMPWPAARAAARSARLLDSESPAMSAPVSASALADSAASRQPLGALLLSPALSAVESCTTIAADALLASPFAGGAPRCLSRSRSRRTPM